MPLDSAQFISELSIDDPPGTDPLNQGDDQIRTTKRATQQSFPNIDAAVPQTAAQMAQMAIKNENNIFTQVNTFDAQLRSFTGSLINPTYSFTGNTGLGMFREQADVLAFTAAGALTFRIAPLNVRFVDQMRADLDGTAARPPYSFNNATGTGMFASGVNIGFAADGATAAFLLPAQFRMNLSGSALAPAYSFQPNTNMGMFRSSNNRMAFATAGISRMDIGTTRTQIFFNVEMPDLPTSDPGVPGRLYAPAGFVQISL